MAIPSVFADTCKILKHTAAHVASVLTLTNEGTKPMPTHRISRTTIDTVAPVIQAMGKSGAVPRSEAHTLTAILRDAAKIPKLEDKVPKANGGLLTAKQVANRLNCSRHTVYRMADEGNLTKRYLRPGMAKSLRFSEAEVAALCDVHANGED